MPLSQKSRIRREQIFLLIHGILGTLLIVASINAIALISARYILINNFKSLRENTTRVNQDLFRVENNIKEINKKIDDAEKIQKPFLKWSEFFSDASALIPKNIYVDFFYADREASSFRLSGLAKDRESIIELKELLENSTFASKLESPLSNFMEKEQIEFRFSGTLKKNIYENLKTN